MPPLRTARAALLPFTGEGARRGDEGARAQRSAAFDFASGGREQVRLASLAPSSGARTHITSGSLNASGSSSAEPIGMRLQNTFLSPCTLSTRATGGQYFCWRRVASGNRSEEHPSELQSQMRISYAVFRL